MLAATNAIEWAEDNLSAKSKLATFNIANEGDKTQETQEIQENQSLGSCDVVPFFTANSIFSLLKTSSGLMHRPSQSRLAYLVKEGMVHDLVSAIEAPTGTGKTLGYLAGALEARGRLTSGETKSRPIVVSTATVALQNQIMTQDIPRLQSIGALKGVKTALAKGRGRYFCARNAQAMVDKTLEDSQKDWLDATKGQVASSEQVIVRTMFKKWKEKIWDGDIDHWEGKKPAQWDLTCAASSQTCVLKACEYYDECAYLQSRLTISQADIVIANHDLVLSDLMQRKDDENKGVLPLGKYYLIVDEAHHFPDKAIEKRKSTIPLTNFEWLRELPDLAASVFKYKNLEKTLKNNPEANTETLTVESLSSLENDLDELIIWLEQLDFKGDEIYTWGEHELPVELQMKARNLSQKTHALNETLKVIHRFLSEKGQTSTGSEKGMVTHLIGNTNFYVHFAQELSNGFFHFFNDNGVVRWAQLTQEGFKLYAQPREAGPILDEILWGKDRSVIFVSATLQVSQSFERFKNKIHLPHGSVTEGLPAVFDYSRGFLHTPPMNSSPLEPEYSVEVLDKIEKILGKNPVKGILVLFTSKKLLSEVHKNINSSFKPLVLAQGSSAMPDLIEKHRAAIDQGNRSILFGLDSMAEGLDLPGIYCEQVIITRLPFGNPRDPIEKARQEALGHNWFAEVYLCDMITKLIQACGRLIRRETDKGVISVLDKRLSNRKYGQTAIASLPQFTRCNQIKHYLENPSISEDAPKFALRGSD